MDLQAMRGSSALGSRNYTDLVWEEKSNQNKRERFWVLILSRGWSGDRHDWKTTNDTGNVFLAAFSTVFHVVKRFVEYFQPQRWRRGVQHDQPASCNRRLRPQNIPLSCITSLPLSTNGSAIQFHTSWLRLRQTLIWDWGSIPQQRQRSKWHQVWWSEEKRWVNECEGNKNGGRW